MRKNKLSKRIISALLASFLIAGAMPTTAFAKTSFSTIKSGHYLLWNGQILEPNNTFGAYAYVPGLSYATNEFNANTLGHAYLDFLKGTDYTGQGSRASRTANQQTVTCLECMKMEKANSFQPLFTE